MRLDSDLKGRIEKLAAKKGNSVAGLMRMLPAELETEEMEKKDEPPQDGKTA